MSIPGLKNIPSEFRDVYEHAYEILQRLRARQAELTILMEGEKNKVVRNKLSKERTNINRWLGDVTQAPETFTGIELSKYTDKQLGQRVHTVARSLMDRFNIDPRKASAGGSTQHHIDSIMQVQGAYEGASVDTIFRINESLKEKGIYLGTNAEGRNFYDVDLSTHPDFHKLTPDEKVDYTNKWAKIEAMPSATPAERIARIEASSEITQGIARRAAASPENLSRIENLAAAAESQKPGLGAKTKELFVIGQKDLETVSEVRGALQNYQGATATLDLKAMGEVVAQRHPFANRLIRPALGVAGLTAFGAISDTMAVRAAATTPRTDDMAQTSRDIAGVGGLVGLAALAPPLAPVLGPAAGAFAVVDGAIQFRMARDERRTETQKIMDPDYRVQVVEGELFETKQLEKERRSDTSMLSGAFK